MDAARRLSATVWAATEFMNHDAVCGRHWGALFRDFAEFQLAVCAERGTLAAVGYTIPFCWGGDVRALPAGLDGVLEQGVTDHRRGRPPTALSALLAIVAPDHQGQGLSRAVLLGMKALAAARGLDALFAPVRPTRKSVYPLTPMERYVEWTRSDGTPSTRGSACTGASAASGSPWCPGPWWSRAPWRSGRRGRGCHSRRVAPTWFPARSSR
jgi:GNAT superfamily N-acetyltransferase